MPRSGSSSAAYSARVPERRSGLLLAADPGPRSALQSAVPQVLLEQHQDIYEIKSP